MRQQQQQKLEYNKFSQPNSKGFLPLLKKISCFLNSLPIYFYVMYLLYNHKRYTK